MTSFTHLGAYKFNAALSACVCCLQAASFVVASTTTMTLTFGGIRMGKIGPAPHCKQPITAIATVTSTTGPGAAAPTGNVTLAIASHSNLLVPFSHSLNLALVRHGPKPAVVEKHHWEGLKLIGTRFFRMSSELHALLFGVIHSYMEVRRASSTHRHI